MIAKEIFHMSNPYTNTSLPSSGDVTRIATGVREHRDAQYGDCVPTFRKIAEHWSAYIDTDFKASDVAHLMMLFKMVRNEQSKNVDDLVDIAGYADIKNVCLWVEEQDRLGDEIEMEPMGFETYAIKQAPSSCSTSQCESCPDPEFCDRFRPQPELKINHDRTVYEMDIPGGTMIGRLSSSLNNEDWEVRSAVPKTKFVPEVGANYLEVSENGECFEEVGGKRQLIGKIGLWNYPRHNLSWESDSAVPMPEHLKKKKSTEKFTYVLLGI